MICWPACPSVLYLQGVLTHSCTSSAWSGTCSPTHGHDLHPGHPGHHHHHHHETRGCRPAGHHHLELAQYSTCSRPSSHSGASSRADCQGDFGGLQHQLPPRAGPVEARKTSRRSTTAARTRVESMSQERFWVCSFSFVRQRCTILQWKVEPFLFVSRIRGRPHTVPPAFSCRRLVAPWSATASDFWSRWGSVLVTSLLVPEGKVPLSP